MVDLARLDPAPRGFGQCARCAYESAGSAAICFACASQTMDALPSNRCPICEQDLQGWPQCGNALCRRRDRALDSVRAVSMRTGELERAINGYKFGGKTGWAAIFGRVLVGYLDRHASRYRSIDLITAMPTYLGSGARRSWDHIGLIVQRAAIEAGSRWPFDRADPPAIVKNAETPQLARIGAAAERERVAAEELAPALQVPDPARVLGAQVVVVDDIFTRGTSMNEVARRLKVAGAIEVTGLVLARAPWRGGT